MVGFFSSAAFRDLAPGLAYFLQRPAPQFRLLISPYLTEEDQRALEQSVTETPEFLENRLLELLGEVTLTERALVRHTLECLAYLIAADRLHIKITIIRGGLFHPKVWMFRDGSDSLVCHGSSNMTDRGLRTNMEHVTIARSWLDSTQSSVVRVFEEEFEALWAGDRDYALTIDIPEAVKEHVLLDYAPGAAPTSEDFWAAWKKDADCGLESPPPAVAASSFEASKPRFRIPPHLNFESGDFAHQGKAVRAWVAAGYNGILEMATGSGKTVASLICAYRLFEGSPPLLVVVAAPFLPLVEQWAHEVAVFGLAPVRPGTSKTKFVSVEAVRRLKIGLTNVEAIIVTHDVLCDPAFQTVLQRFSGTSLLIADEVHNLGRESFIANQPAAFTHRLGLSATPERQYDAEGSAVVSAFFGGVVFRFTLAEAIGVCLVPYDYYVHPVQLTAEEVERWMEFTRQLKRLGWTLRSEGPTNDHIRLLLIRRREILENAARKIDTLKALLLNAGTHKLRHTLIYATDKAPQQLQQVNGLLTELGILFHQVTAEETARGQLAQSILRSFSEGRLQVLTAKRVLDEGVDIPQVSQAYILASTTVERQWVQRRGRVLRKHTAGGKTSATIHDFFVVPPDDALRDDADTRKIVKQELERVSEFARLARNAADPGGALALVQPMYVKAFG